MYYDVRFIDVQIRGETLSWTAPFKQFDAATAIRHLKDKGLNLNCSDGARNPDLFSMDEWEDDVLNGRIVRGGTQLIGRVQVKQKDGDMPDLMSPEAMSSGATSLEARPEPVPTKRNGTVRYRNDPARNDASRNDARSGTVRSSAPNRSRGNDGHPFVMTGAGYPSELPASVSDEIPY